MSSASERVSVAVMVKRARAMVANLEPDSVAAELASGTVLLVDLRESEERAQHGVIPGAVHAPRGMLEFYADPASPYYRPEFTPRRRIVLHCASGGRSALAARTLQALGYTDVAHLDGGLAAWRAAGHPVHAVNGWDDDG